MMKIILLSSTLIFTFNSWVSSATIAAAAIMFSMAFMKHDLFITQVLSGLMWDSTSLLLVSLSLWTYLLMVMASMNSPLVQMSSSKFLLALGSLTIILVSTFSVSNFFPFYILFEASLIPTFMIILGWGYQPERIQAGVYMLMYTIFASLPLLLSLIIWDNSSQSLSSLVMPAHSGPTSIISSLWAIISVMAFMVKLPLYFVHLWLPKAHVEAPVAGSMILAGVLLKLGGYGLLRLLPKLGPNLYPSAALLMSWATMGGAMISFLCLVQSDLKHLIALSSVAHMAMVMGGLLSFSQWGWNGSLIIMIGHGFCSSGLFCIANMSYERIKSRSLTMIKGLLTLTPAMTMWWFILSAANMAAPPSLNLMGEINSIVSMLSWSQFLMAPLAMLTFFAAAYSLFMYCSTQHGKPCDSAASFQSPTPIESLTIILHLIPLFSLILNMTLFSL